MTVGVTQETVTLRAGWAFTVRSNAGKETRSVPSVTEMTIPRVIPTLLAPGVPVSAPDEVLNVAQAGLFTIENVSVSPSASAADATKLYAEPCVTWVAGVPEIVGGRFAGAGDDAAFTVRSKAGSDLLALPSDTAMTMPRVTATSAAAGVPVSAPDAVLKLAQEGLLTIANVSRSRSASAALGMKL